MFQRLKSVFSKFSKGSSKNIILFKNKEMLLTEVQNTIPLSDTEVMNNDIYLGVYIISKFIAENKIKLYSHVEDGVRIYTNKPVTEQYTCVCTEEFLLPAFTNKVSGKSLLFAINKQIKYLPQQQYIAVRRVLNNSSKMLLKD